MTIRFEEFKARLLANPEVNSEYEALAAEFEKPIKLKDREKQSPPKKSSNSEFRRV